MEMRHLISDVNDFNDGNKSVKLAPENIDVDFI